MRLFAKIDGATNNRFDRAAYLTPPFDLNIEGSPSSPGTPVTGSDSESSDTIPRVPTAAGGGYAQETDDLLEASPAGDFLEIFSTFSPTDNSSVYNTSCWAASLDFTGTAWHCVDSGDGALGATFQTGTLVSPRHAIVASHSNWHSGGNTPWKVTWIAADGTAYQREILEASGSVGGTDIEILYLDEDLPSTIANYKVLPADYQDYIPNFPGDDEVLNLSPDYEIRLRPPTIAATHCGRCWRASTPRLA